MKEKKINFTKAALDTVSLPPEGQRTRIYDSKIRGLLLEISSKGSKTFWLRRKINGRSIWERIGYYPDLSIEQARNRVAEINGAIAQGHNPFEARKQWNEEMTLTIPETKNGTSQTVALTATEVQLLTARSAIVQGPFVFPGRGPSGHLMDPKKGWAKVLERAGIKDCTLHDLRRKLGSWMASQNVNVALIQSALHHKDIKTTLNVYARTAKDAERKGREVAHSAMFDAAGILLPFRKPTQSEGVS